MVPDAPSETVISPCSRIAARAEAANRRANITLDWSDMETNAPGRPFGPIAITEAPVGHYLQTPAELEKRFLDLIATEL